MNLEQQLQHVLKQLSSLGYDARELVFAPPAKPDEVRALEHDLGFPLPSSFRDALLAVSGHVEFTWFTRDLEFPQPFQSNFSGDLHWSVEFTKSFNEAKNGWVTEVFPNPSDPYDSVWHNKLAFYEVGNGDYLAIDLNPSTYEHIVYLSHDDGEGHGHVLAEDFLELLRRWVPLACPGGEDWQWLPFTNDLTTTIDPNCHNAKAWCELLKIAT